MKRYLTRLLSAVLLVAFVAGCYSVEYTTNKKPMTRPVERTQSFFLAGLIGEAEVDLNRICPGGVARIEYVHTFGDQLLTLITLTIYSPTTLVVWCTAPERAYLIGLDEAGEVLQIEETPSLVSLEERAASSSGDDKARRGGN